MRAIVERAEKTHHTASSGGWRTALFVILLCMHLGGCAGLDQERNLAPLFAQYSPAGGGVEVEAFGGALLARKYPDTGRWDERALKPLYSSVREANGDRYIWFIPPLGRNTSIKRESEGVRERVWRMLPIFRYARRDPLPGYEGNSTWNMITLPGIYWAKTVDGRIVRAWFPFGGVAEHFFSFDRLEFVLWPLWTKIKRNGRTTYHFLFPIFSWSKGAGGPSWRFWPLIGRNQWEGRYDNWFFLWPFFQWQKDNEDIDPELEGTAWWLFPFVGHKRLGDMQSTSVLWPIFGYASNPETGFWAWDGPWPFVRFMRSGKPNGPKRSRVWPFYSYYEGEGLKTRHILWPFINDREEHSRLMRKTSNHVFPFFRSSDREHALEGTEKYRKFWPFYHRTEGNTGGAGSANGGEDYHTFTLGSLNPLWRTPIIDYHYGWLWELYTEKEIGSTRRERAWMGLWRREKDADEDRRALSLLWARRDYSMAGKRVRETSFLFGLLRFRHTEGAGYDWLKPALPGPGWPMERVPSSLLPELEQPQLPSLQQDAAPTTPPPASPAG